MDTPKIAVEKLRRSLLHRRILALSEVKDGEPSQKRDFMKKFIKAMDDVVHEVKSRFMGSELDEFEKELLTQMSFYKNMSDFYKLMTNHP